MRKFLFLLIIAALGVMSSCSKNRSPESMLVGEWRQQSVEYLFAAHSIEKRAADDVVFVFRGDGTCTVKDGEEVEESRYYIEQNILYVGTDDAYVISMNADELVLSEGFSQMHIYGGTDNFKKFTTFKGIQIYLDNYEEYCYQKGTEWYGCERLDDGADGDPAGAVFYDCTYGYFSRVN